MTRDMKIGMILHTIAEFTRGLYPCGNSLTREILFPRWEQNIPTLGTKHSHAGNKKTGLRLALDEITARRQRDYGSCPTRLRFVVLILLTLVLGVGEMWGQDYSGTYYIASDYHDPNNNSTPIYNPTTLTNNYYLCPTENWISYTAESPNWETGDAIPFLTTYKARNHNNYDITKAKWTIEYYTTVNGTDYYYFKHSSGNYMVLNDAISAVTGNNNAAMRLRVHLETLTPEQLELEDTRNRALFSITQDGRSIVIKPKTQQAYQLTVNNGNSDYLRGNGTGKGYIQSGNTKYGTEGTIAIYNQNNDDSKYFYLEDYITRPTITYNDASHEITITAVQLGATLIYTTDGSTPTTSNGTPVNNTTITFNPSDGATTIKAVAVVNGELSNIATFTTPFYLGSNHKYLIQSQNNAWNTTSFHFYMIPGDEENSVIKLNTTSLFRPTMEWYFLDAGDGYCYIVNNSAKDNSNNPYYLCYDATNKVYMETYSEDNKFKFSIVESPTAGTFNIIPYGLSSGDRFVFKSSGNANANAIGLTNSNTSENARWTFIASNALDKNAPYSASNATSSSYYKIASVGDNTYYFVPPSGNNTNATASNSNDVALVKSGIWFFEVAQEADASDWCTYYYIRNAETGKYLYFTKDDTNYASDPKACLIMKSSIEIGEEDCYMFTWARTATNGTYYIVPKKLKDAKFNLIGTLQRNGTTLQSNMRRDAGNYAWTFESTTFKCETPAINYNPLTGTISITCGTPGAMIYVAHYNSEPSSSDIPELVAGNVYSGEFDALPGYYKAVASRSTGGDDMSDAATSELIEEFHCTRPIITKQSDHVTITCATPGATIYYIAGSGEFSENAENYGGTLYTESGFDTSETVIKAIAVKGGVWSTKSAEALYDKTPTTITSGAQIINMDGVYVVGDSFTPSSAPIGSATDPFTGEFDGNFKTFELSHPLFAYVSGATIKNVIISNANNISTSANAGVIANVASGDTRIYNCGINSGSVSGSNNVGGIVGSLDGSSRVINCYSYANITGGTNKGGIVGYNSYASKSGDIRTMVMNCMFYGDISSGGTISPIYGGELIDNQKTDSETGLNNYNYYRYESDYSYDNLINKYNNALAAKEEYLNRFEFYRQMLNSNKKLAAYYATGSANNANQKMAKWVLETADRQNSNPYPYPILKPQAKYPSIINYDAEHATQLTLVNGKPSEADRNKGGKISTLTVNIAAANTWTNAPANAGINNGKSSLTLVRTDKDEDHFNFNYDKVQLPYYNDVGTNNYTDNKVVTGWKITGVTIGSGDDVATQGSYSASDSWGGYNFADRKTYAKDLYSVSGRVFSQGAYFDVPYGATAITIEPYWGNAAYICDEKLDVVYNSEYSTPTDILESQFTFNNGTATGAFNGQNVYSNISTALNTLSGSTVYDNALVLVGNRHLSTVPASDSKHFTIMSVDEDYDNEPDYSLIYHHSGRVAVSPIRFDFLNVMGTAQAQMPREGEKFFNVGIFNFKGWFEITNTCLIYFSQIEYDNGGKAAEPLILLGGVVDQIVSNHENSPSKTTTYIHVGSNVRFKQFSNGCHSDRWDFTKHIPVSVTGGDYQEFYLSGMYRPDAQVITNTTDNAECYISSGRFGELAGAGQQMINGNVQWQIYNADINNFYGGGINAAYPITGNITVNLYNSHIGTYCGGPKFGNMQKANTSLSYIYASGNDGKTPAEGSISITGTDRIVTTEANGCTFGSFFGAGYGGTSFNRVRTRDAVSVPATFWEGDYTGIRGNYSENNNGIATDFDYDFFVWSTGQTGGRFYVKYASLSTAQTNNVTSTLTNCIVNGNVYGGGKLGRVAGKATTTLNGCTVNGDVFGAGYSGALEPVKVRDGGFGGNPVKYPSVNTNSGMFEDGEFSGTTDYIWKEHTLTNGASNITTEGGKNYIYTDVDLDVLGQVDDAELKIQSNTNVTGSVYGGGEEANVNNDTEISMSGGTVNGDVFGGGKGTADEFTCAKAMVGVVNLGVTDNGENANPRYTLLDGGTTVSITNGTVKGNVYGGGEVGRVERNTLVEIGSATHNGTPIIEGSVFGAGAGVTTHGYSALVRGNTTVTIQGTAQVWKNVYGGGEKASVGRYYVASSAEDVNTYHVPIGMPCYLKAGGKCTVNILGSATIGTDNNENTGHVFGAGQGVDPHAVTYTYQSNETKPSRMKNDNTWEYFGNESAYLTFVETLARASETDVNISGGTIKGSVFGGSESGFVYHSTDINIQNGTINGNVYGGGKGLMTYAEAGRVRENTKVTMSNGAVKGNVYGGGSLGDVGRINKTLSGYNYKWTDGDIDENTTSFPWNNTGLCEVIINGGTIGSDGTSTANHASGHVFGAGKGATSSFYCEKAMVYKTNVSITKGTIYGNVYGGGEVGRVENNAVVSIEGTNDNDTDIKGGIFGAGAGVETHGYSALLRGDATVTIQGKAKVGMNVYGGGEAASVGRFKVENSLPKEPLSGGTCTVTIQGDAKIGTGNTGGSVYGACKGVEPGDYSSATHVISNGTSPGFANNAEYLAFLQTLALTSNTIVTIAGNASVNGSVYGGGRRGITLGRVQVSMTGGTVNQDVYGGGALADTNTGNWNADYGSVAGITAGTTIVTGYYTRSGAGTQESPYTYTEITAANTTAAENTTYYSRNSWAHATLKSAYYTTTVNLTGGLIKGDAYGGGLGQKTGFNGATSDIAAVVYGNIAVTLNGTAFEITKYTDTGYTDVVKSGRVFGCNNLLGSPQGNVTVTVNQTVSLDAQGAVKTKPTKKTNAYELAAVYGGGNLAPYLATGMKTHVIVHGCSDTSIETVYGGGNAAAVPETAVDIYSAYEIGALFGGGNGKDKYKNDSGWQTNPGANVNGNTNTLIYGGTVHEAYGGSNEKGTITGDVSIDVAETNPESCTLDVEKLVGAGKNADVNGDLIMVMGCKPSTKIPLLFAGADNANVKGNVELTITSGNFGKVFGGNNAGGVIFGHIKLNIEETGTCGTPITIDELYLGGNEAAYSQYGYYNSGTVEAPVYQPRTSASDTHTAVGHPATDATHTFPFAQPELNVISCTYIGKIFGGGYGGGATLYGNPIVNINMIPGSFAGNTTSGVPAKMTALNLPNTENTSHLGIIGDVYGGGNAAPVNGNTTVNIGTATTVTLTSVDDDPNTNDVDEKRPNVLGAYITGNVFGGGNQADVTGDTKVNICGTQEQDPNPVQGSNGYIDSAVDHSGTTGFAVSIGNSVYGGGNSADVLGNTFVTFADGYVFNGIFGGGLSGSVGTFTTSTASSDVNIWGHTAHEGTCIGKPTACATGTGTCYVVVSGGQIGPLEVATLGMNRTTNGHGDPVPQGWVWGAGCGLVEDPSEEPDTHFKTYVNNTDVTIKGDAFILESIIGGGEFGRVLGNTLVKIEGGQIGVGYNKVTDGKPVAYTAAQWTEAEAAVRAGDASRINAIAAAMPACSTFPYGREVNGKMVYDTYDPFADAYKTAQNSDKYPGGSTDHASDGKTWIGCVFAGGSGYMPYVKRNNSNVITDYDWVQSAGWVEGDAEVRISGGHILSNVYGGNEYTDVKGTCIVKMSGGTVGVPRTVEQIMGNPMIGYIYGAGKGDPRVHFNKVTNVGDVEVEITGGTVFGSVYGGGEDGHVLRDVSLTINTENNNVPFIGTWGTSYVDGNVFGGGRGFSGEAYTAGNVAGSVTMVINGGTMLGSVYGGGRMGSVGYGLYDATTNNEPTPGYGEMRDDDKYDDDTNGSTYFTKGRGHIDITISGGTIGNNYEYIMPNSTNMPSGLSVNNIGSWTSDNWTAWKAHNNIHKTEFDTATRQLKHTKGGNVFAGGMGNLYEQDGTTNISLVDWWKLGCVKSTKLTITGGTIKSNVYGGGELGQVVGCHTTDNVKLGTEISISGSNTLIGTEVKESSASEAVSYTFGSVFGGGYGSLEEKITLTGKPDSYPKYIAGRVMAGTKVNMTAGTVKASVYGGGEMAAVGESVVLGETLTDGLTGDTHVTISGGTIGKSGFGGAKMGNVYGGGSGHNNTVRSGQVYGNTNVTINGGTIFHNIYGGGAYGTVGDFAYITQNVNDVPKVFGVSGRSTDHTNSGVATVTITGGTIGINGKENGMVFGSSRGDVNRPEERDDHTAWVYDANVTIGDANGGPAIKGSIYGSGENGHTFNNAVVTINNGTIGIASGEPIVSNNGTPDDTSDDITYNGAAYPYRGNVYGGGCGTDKYYEDHAQETHDGHGQLYNPLAGIVYGNATVNINGGTIVRNVYGAGAMGSVGKITVDNETTTITGGQTRINISGGTIGVDGTAGVGNVFGAARGSSDATGNNLALVAGNTSVSITGGTMYGNVYGGGELGYVGKFTSETNPDTGSKTYTWPANTGHCEVAVNGATATVKGHVFGAGKGSASTYECEPAMVKSASVTIGNGTVGTLENSTLKAGTGNVYGGGQLGRVEENTVVTIGAEGETEGTNKPDIKGDVFGAGAGVATHGYSALVRGNSTVTVQGKANVGGSVYGGGETASVGKFRVVNSLPKEPLSGGTCTVTVNGGAAVTGDIFGACKGVTPDFAHNGGHWMSDNQSHAFTGENAETDYLAFLKTLALTSNTNVTIGETATVGGSVYGGGQRGITLGSVAVNMTGGTVNKDVYGGGALADTNTGNATGYGTASESLTSTSTYTTTVNLKGGMIKGDAYGGGLGQLGDDPIPAKVYGDVAVNLGTANDDTAPATEFYISNYTATGHTDVVKSGRIFGCNNLNGTPLGNVTVTINRTVEGNVTRTAEENLKNTNATHTYEVAAVYGGGNLAGYAPSSTVTGAKLKVLINGCDVSIDEVYGGGNAAPVPATDVEVMGAYEINQVFGGGNGQDAYTLNGTDWIENPGANVGGNTNTILRGGLIHEAYGGSNEKGEIAGDIVIDTGSGGCSGCPLDLEKMVGAGKNADVNGNLIVVMGCKPETKIPLLYAGADNANVNGNVELTITSGNFGKVFGGNNEGGAIRGHIILNIEETGECETPITIDELYLGGNNAAYSRYGYYVKTNETEAVNGTGVGASGETAILTDGRLTFMPRTSADDPHLPVKTYTKTGDTWTWETDLITGDDAFEPYAQPVLNVTSCTSIGEVFGGGYGVGGTMYADPTVNINMIPGGHANGVPDVMTAMSLTSTDNPDKLGIIGNVYGGGNAADVIGNPTVNIGTASTVDLHLSYNKTTGAYSWDTGKEVKGAYIKGNVFGAGKGKNDTFTCEKAMVGKDGDGLTNPNGGPTVIIYKGKVLGNVYGGGEVGRVEKNTVVTIGKEGDETSAPEIRGYVFGGGKGLETHGYSALVRGNPRVTIQGSAKIGKSVYGGGQIASVGNFFVKGVSYPAALNAPTPPADFPEGMPYALKDDNSGKCTVIVRDKAEIGPDNMKMEKRDAQNNLLRPDDLGHVFGAGKGIMPYEDTNDPKRMDQNSQWESYANNENGYITFIETLGMTASTDVTITGDAFVKGSVYGGSENGHVLHNTKVTIAGDCQIGNGDGKNRRYTNTEWTNENPSDFAECASWPYGKQTGTDANNNPIIKYLPYDVYDYVEPNAANPVPKAASDGHTYYGNVFGGGSGIFPYKKKAGWQKNQDKTNEVGQPVDENGYSDGIWLRSAGAVFGNTEVNITGGHILTSVYGGNECTDVGKYQTGSTTYEAGTGHCTVNMVGGTVGVPRTLQQMQAHPVTCYLFGAGKGDQRINFNTWTNVASTQVNISGTARIYGSTFGGGEDGHVIGDAETNIGGTVTIGNQNYTPTDDLIIGTTGTSYVDGNVFGGGRGFSGDAQTAGTVGGNIRLNISGGKMLGSIYGGGRLASVGTQFAQPEDSDYGQFEEDDNNKTYGHVTVNISGCTIGNESGNAVSGNVFGGSMGRLTLLDNTINPFWPELAQVKSATVNITQPEGKTTLIKRNVYGGGEYGTVRENTYVTIGGTRAANGTISPSGKPTINGSVYGGGYGSDDYGNPTTAKVYWNNDWLYYTYTPMQWAGCVGGNTTVSVAGGHVKQNVYGGGQLASVGIINYQVNSTTQTINGKPNYLQITKHADIVNEGETTEKVYGFGLSWPYEFTYVPCKPNTTEVGGKTTVNVTGGRIGTGWDDGTGYVFGAGKGKAFERYTEAFCANVRETEVNINYGTTAAAADVSTADCIASAVYGGGEDGHVYENTAVNITGGLIGLSVYGGGKGEGTYKGKLRSRTSPYDWNDDLVDLPSWTAGKVYGNTSVNMSGGHVLVNIYGGGNMGSVGKGNYAGGTDDYYPAGYGETLTNQGLWTSSNNYNPANPISTSNKPATMADYFLGSGKCTVNITGGTVGTKNTVYGTVNLLDQKTPTGMVFGGSRGRAAEDIGALSPRYAFAPDFFLGYVNSTAVTIGDSNGGPTIYSQVFGGGRDGHVRNSTHVIINNGTIGQAYAEYNTAANDINKESQRRNCGNVYGSGSGMGTWNGTNHGTSSGSVTRNTTVDINGGNIYGNVYGGGAMSSVGPPKITMPDFAAENWSKCTVNINGGNIGVGTDFSTYGYGGCVFGASRGGDLTTGEQSVEGNLDNYATTLWNEVNIKGGTIAGDVYGGGQAGRVKKDNKVILTGGTVAHDVYGGGMGTSTIAANVGGNTTVTLNGTKFIPTYDTDGTPTAGRLFGCNNVNGTPKGHAKVHVRKTVDSTKNPEVALANRTTYDVAAVYGGGNNADYRPTSTDEYAEVIIEGCDLTSIKDVYGGGNAAATPANSVLVKGCYVIDNVFGGGNGTVTAANVGYNETGYVTKGTAKTNLSGGYIHNVYGGSNSQGNVLGGASVTNDKYTGDGCCDVLQVQEMYGGGKNANMFGGAEIVLGCMPDSWIDEIYAGAENADVGNDVSLTITSGKFGRVFGGNKSGGKLDGYIEVNIEEGNCDTPIIIGELYGGGNMAPYSIYGYDDENHGAVRTAPVEDQTPHTSPRVNVRAFTSIGAIYGGGYGERAVMVGSPTVNINVVMVEGGGKAYAGETKTLTDDDGNETSVVLYPHEKNKIGVIGTVFGGGNAAMVDGNTNVNIGTESSVKFESQTDDTIEGSDKRVSKTVVGADIKGNVYGGGNNAKVTGNTNVVIGQEKVTTTTP